MAGISVELRKLLRSPSYAGLLKAYSYAGLISAGPWVLSILMVMVVGVFSLDGLHQSEQITAFLVSITYLIAASLIYTGFFQLVFIRFAADREYENKRNIILPNFLALTLAINIVACVLGIAVLHFFFQGTPLLYQVEMYIAFLCLCNIWMLTIFLSGIKNYKAILFCFAIAYGFLFVLSVFFRQLGLTGLLGAFTISQGLLMVLLLAIVVYEYRGSHLLGWQWLKMKNIKFSLIFTGFFYNLGIWSDKLMFWFNPNTSVQVIGPLRASPIYDFPMFLAYLSIVPGMAVFFMRIETDFADRYDDYYSAILQGGSLTKIEYYRYEIIAAAKNMLSDVFKIQGVTVVALFLVAPYIIKMAGFSELYIPLFNIDIVGVGMQLCLMVVLNMLFYLDKLKSALRLTALFTVLNLSLTYLSQHLGIAFYGYGFALATSITAVVGLVVLSQNLEKLSYETFMFQPGPK